MAMQKSDLILSSGARAPRTEVIPRGADWEEQRKYFDLGPLALAIARFTALSRMHGRPIIRETEHALWAI